MTHWEKTQQSTPIRLTGRDLSDLAPIRLHKNICADNSHTILCEPSFTGASPFPHNLFCRRMVIYYGYGYGA